MSDEKLGPTGQFPRGKLREDDEGETQVLIGHQEGNVFMDLGAPTSWVAFPPDVARKLATAIWNHANAVDGKGPILAVLGPEGT